jgi:Zn-dependent alcohol dehydrogenase
MNANGRFGEVAPTILAHASTGAVEELGSDVTGVRVGDRVVVHGRTIVSSQNGRVRMRHDIPRYVRMLEEGLVDSSLVVTGRYPSSRSTRPSRTPGTTGASPA